MPAVTAPPPSQPAEKAGNARTRRRMVRPEIVLFVGLLAAYGATINTRALYHFSLHQGVVRVLVERGRLYLREFDPREPLGGDVFVYDGRVYANKQPGSFLLGAAVYRILRQGGLTYRGDLYLTAALVSLLTSGLLTAMTAVLVYRIARARCGDSRWALGAALAFGLGSSAFPYAGTLHHDVLASACLVGGFAVRRRPLLAGVLLGLALTSSLLPVPMIVVLLTWLIVAPPEASHPARLRRALYLGAGLALGMAPLLACNWASLGAPWRMPLLAGALWPESSPRFDPANALRLLVMYGRLLLWYTPIVLAGGLGLVWATLRRVEPSAVASTAVEWRARALKHRESVLIVALLAAQLVFVVSLDTDGACQYGPRLLLPAMPFACLGLTAFAGGRWSRRAAAVLVVVGLASATINLVGALYGTMYCDAPHYGFAHYLNAIRHRIFFSFPLLGIEGEPPY